ncbi:MAG: hypothetical protein H6739_17990 [Alphaproteobacteria bacterium]|nr:hypothetical protein [Alphaproteobacteria bacterium]
MSKRVTRQVVDPTTLTDTQRDVLCAELYAAHSRVFEGVDAAAFRHYVVEPDADATRLLLVRDDQGALVGYAAAHAYTCTVDGRQVLVGRAEAGVERGWRRAANVGDFVARALLGFRFRWPTAKMYYLGAFVHPSAYSAFLRRCASLRPSPDHPLTPAEESLVDALAERFGMPRVEGMPLGVRYVGWCTRESSAEQSYWRRRQDPLTRHYVTLNPRFDEGYGLLVLVPGELSVVFAALGGLVGNWLTHQLGALGRLADRLGWRAAASARTLLELGVAQASDEAARLSRHARVRHLGAGQVIDLSDGEVAVVRRGAVALVRGEAIVAQRGTREWLSREEWPGTTLRAATHTELVVFPSPSAGQAAVA